VQRVGSRTLCQQTQVHPSLYAASYVAQACQLSSKETESEMTVFEGDQEAQKLVGPTFTATTSVFERLFPSLSLCTPTIGLEGSHG
jgi:hypothetical protein